MWFRAQSLTGPAPGVRTTDGRWLGKRQYRGTVQQVRSAHHLAPDPVSASAGDGYLFLYEGRFARAPGWSALAVIVGTAFIGRPHPSLSGHGLVILVSLIVAAATQVVITAVPHADRRRHGAAPCSAR